MDVDSFNHLPADEKICQLGLISKSSLEHILVGLLSIVQSPASPPDLVVATYRALLRNQNPSLVDLARKHFNHADSRIAAAAIEYAGKLSPEWFVRVSGKLLQKRSRAVYRAAVKTLNRLSPDAAISAIRAMIASNQTKQLGNAINCMIFLDFSVVREIATELAVNTRDDEIFGAIMLLFQNNPELENLKCLFRIEKNQKNPAWSDLARHIRHENTSVLNERDLLGRTDPAAIETNLARDYTISQQPLAAGTSQKGQRTILCQFTDLLRNLKFLIEFYLAENRALALAIPLLAVLIFFLYPVVSEPTRMGTAVIYSPRAEIAHVKECRQDYAIIELRSDSSRIKIRPLSGQFICENLANQNVEVELVLYRISRKGDAMAVCTRIKRILQS